MRETRVKLRNKPKYGRGSKAAVSLAYNACIQLIADEGSVMQAWLSSWLLFLIPSWALAATKEIEQGATAPVEQVDVVWVVIFVVGFVVMIVGYCWYVWWADKKRKEAGGK